MSNKKIIRELALQVAEISANQYDKKVQEWKDFNTFKSSRPMVVIDQLPWHELNPDTDMKILTEGDALAQRLEWHLRKMIYCYKNFPVDMVVLPYIEVLMHREGGFSFDVSQDISAIDEKNTGCTSHAYHGYIKNEDDLDKLFSNVPPIKFLKEETMKEQAQLDELLDGAMPTKIVGFNNPWYDVWDTMPQIYGVEECINDLIERPEFIHEVMKRFQQMKMTELDQIVEQGLLTSGQPYIHCSGAYTDELQTYEYPEKAETKRVWGAGLAQIFSTVSPSMHKEFELDYAKDYYSHCGLVYYGCCDPLHLKVDIICDAIPNVRKISMSPWVNQEIGAERLADRKVIMSRKPNPALLVDGAWDEEFVENDLRETKDICERHGCQLEYILKDVSTLNYKPERLYKWAEIAMKVANE